MAKTYNVYDLPIPLKKQFEEGYWSFYKGVLINPYRADGPQQREWARGWNRAYFDNLDTLKKQSA